MMVLFVIRFDQLFIALSCCGKLAIDNAIRGCFVSYGTDLGYYMLIASQCEYPAILQSNLWQWHIKVY